MSCRPDDPVFTGTHHAGCACHEARHDAEVAALKERIVILKEALAHEQHCFTCRHDTCAYCGACGAARLLRTKP